MYWLEVLFRFEGTVDRRTYAAVGVCGFLLKHLVDRGVAGYLFEHNWDIFSYWHSPFRPTVPFSSLIGDTRFAATMLAIALPFIWVGLVLTVKRLCSLGQPAWLAMLFFVPVVNLLFFLLLSVLPTSEEQKPGPDRSEGRVLDRWIPHHPLGSAALGVVLTLLFLFPTVWLATTVAMAYGWSLFVGAPFCVGFFATLIYSFHQYRSPGSCTFVATLSLLCGCVLLLALAFEGIVCIIMAFPLAWILAVCGAVLGYAIQRHARRFSLTAQVVPLAALLCVTSLLENRLNPSPPVFSVVSEMMVNAPPDRVWPQVISFAELGPPVHWLFRIGIAYPLRAEIHGSGPGAVRHCVFSTGAFVEPIQIWDAPRHLKFSVAENPPPMEEWTPYRSVQPRHLDGFLESKAGEFWLEPLPEGRTLLRGTTWYHHRMWPAAYWKWWSDFIIHRIHLRVLAHIKKRAEE